ncbi:MAG TPA: serine/threonine-protein kinase [Fimbriiglobus sp.]|jgi:serine/threonine protein kinase
MPATKTLTRSPFLAAIAKSGLIQRAELDEFLAHNDPTQQARTDPIKLASLFVRKKVLTKFQAMQLLAGKTQGFRLGRYTILDGIRQDRVGMVFLAEDTSSHKQVSIKILPTDRVADNTILSEFTKEVRLAARVDHAHVARVLDMGVWNETHFVATEYVPGPTLDKVVAEKGPMQANQAAQYIAQAAVALRHAHDHGFFHRDVKPGNLALTPTGGIKLLDLGLTHMLENPWQRVTKRINTKEFAEEIDHVPPEQAWGCAQDARSDIYSLGSTLYYLLTAQSPFPGSAAEKMAARQIRGVPRPSLVQPNVPRDLDHIVQKMTAKDPHERYQNTNEVVAALSPWLPVNQWVTLGAGLNKDVEEEEATEEPEVKKDSTVWVIVGVLGGAVALVAVLAALFAK